MPHTKEWTLMFYLASDNPLAPSIVSQLKAIKDAGYHPEVNVIAHFDPHTPGTPTHVFDVNHVAKLKARGASQVGYANSPYVRNLTLDKLWGNEKDEDINIRKLIMGQIGDALSPRCGARGGDGHGDKGVGVDGHVNNGHAGNGHVNGASATASLPAGTFATGVVGVAEINPVGIESSRVITTEPDPADVVPAAEGEFDFELPALSRKLCEDSCPAESLKNFVEFCKETYPARRYILFLLGHGLVVGNNMFLLDEHPGGQPRRPTPPSGGALPPVETNGHGAPYVTTATAQGEATDAAPQSLSLKDLSDALDVFKTDGGRSQLELVSFHSCSMSGLEVAYELRGKANYMLASQGLAFVGSWPYKQILLRLFNDLNAPLSAADLNAPSLLSSLKAGGDAVSEYLRGKFSEDTTRLLYEYDGSKPREDAAVAAVVGELNKALKESKLSDDLGGMAFDKSDATLRLMGRSRSVRGANRRRLNRLLLADAYGKATPTNRGEGDGHVIAPNRVTNPAYVKELLTEVFYNVLYNSYDFQLAGYSFDLCLCDIDKVGKLTQSIGRLARALRAGLAGDAVLEGGAESMGRELILLAHWDAQSFWQESYTDLYDFCFRLKRRCEHVFPALKTSTCTSCGGGPPSAASPVMREIVAACADVMDELERGVEGNDDCAVVRADFAGAECQYAHGLSVYFPWSRPAGGFFEEQYKGYGFAAETGWYEFLDAYFTKTRREPHGQENSARRKVSPPQEVSKDEALSEREKCARESRETEELERKLREMLLRSIGTRVLPDERLAKGAGNDATGAGKGAGNDASGGDCDCPSFKNYPPFTGLHHDGAANAYRAKDELDGQAYGPTFYEQARIR